MTDTLWIIALLVAITVVVYAGTFWTVTKVADHVYARRGIAKTSSYIHHPSNHRRRDQP